MREAPQLAEIASLVGDPARANMLAALLDARALSAADLAWRAGVTPQTASAHLAKLTDARLLARERQGRHRYYRLASPLVGQMLEGLMAVAAAGAPPAPPAWRGGEALRHARTCYDHLAGRVAVAIADTLAERRHVVLAPDGGEVTASGRRFFAETLGIDLAPGKGARRCFCRPCLDWSERRPHLAGYVGAALAARAFDLGWVARIKDSRALTVTAAGRKGLAAWFGIGEAAADANARAP